VAFDPQRIRALNRSLNVPWVWARCWARKPMSSTRPSSHRAESGRHLYLCACWGRQHFPIVYAEGQVVNPVPGTDGWQQNGLADSYPRALRQPAEACTWASGGHWLPAVTAFRTFVVSPQSPIRVVFLHIQELASLWKAGRASRLDSTYFGPRVSARIRR